MAGREIHKTSLYPAFGLAPYTGRVPKEASGPKGGEPVPPHLLTPSPSFCCGHSAAAWPSQDGSVT